MTDPVAVEAEEVATSIVVNPAISYTPACAAEEQPAEGETNFPPEAEADNNTSH